MDTTEMWRKNADRAMALLEQKDPKQLAVELVEMHDKHTAAMDALSKMRDQRDQLAAQLSAAKRSWPDKCPITRRDFFMEIDGVPTYGGPFDSYTIPEMLGTPEQPWHERELFVRRFDHDRGCWVDDEIISQRVIHDGVLDDLLDEKDLSIPKGWQLVPVDATRAMIDAAEVVEEDGYAAMHSAMLAAAPKPQGGAQ